MANNKIDWEEFERWADGVAGFRNNLYVSLTEQHLARTIIELKQEIAGLKIAVSEILEARVVTLREEK